KPLGVLPGHQGSVLALALAADGRRVLSADGGRLVHLWDPTKGEETGTWKTISDREERETQQHKGGSLWLAFSANAGLLARAEDVRASGPIRAWDATTGEELARWGDGQGPVEFLALSGDGRLLAAGREEHEVHLYEARTGKEVRRFPGHETNGAAALSPDGRLLAAAAWDGAVWLWDTARGVEIRKLEAPRGASSVA